LQLRDISSGEIGFQPPKRNKEHKKKKLKSASSSTNGGNVSSATATTPSDNRTTCIILKEDTTEQAMGKSISSEDLFAMNFFLGVEVLPVPVAETAISVTELVEINEPPATLSPVVPVTGNSYEILLINLLSRAKTNKSLQSLFFYHLYCCTKITCNCPFLINNHRHFVFCP
jgi:hypothetical protein